MDELITILEGVREGGQHAFLILGDGSTVVPVLKQGIETVFERKLDSDPDYYESVSEGFNIGEARKIRMLGQKRSSSVASRFFVISANNFTEESQNALLKTLEEPIPGHYFFIITPDEHRLLPTVKSRMQKLNFFPEVAFADSLSERFLTSSVQDRILMIPEIVIEKDEPSTQRIAVKNFVTILKQHVFDEFKSRDFYDKNTFESVMSEISKVEKYAGDIASAPRLLLEYLSFICPRQIVEE